MILNFPTQRQGTTPALLFNQIDIAVVDASRTDDTLRSTLYFTNLANLGVISASHEL